MYPCACFHNLKLLTATEFFMSATAEANSLNCNSGQYGMGNRRSPDNLLAKTAASSHCSLLVSKAPWYFPVLTPCGEFKYYNPILKFNMVPYLLDCTMNLFHWHILKKNNFITYSYSILLHFSSTNLMTNFPHLHKNHSVLRMILPVEILASEML
jgi:hypothetical protein